MNIWLLHVGEELPVDPHPRLFRYGHLAERLASDGHQVLRWAPTFQHFRKVQRFSQDKRVEISANYKIQFVHCPGYQRNVSFARRRAYSMLGLRLSELFAAETPPDLIVAGLPSLEWCEAAVEYGHRNGVPVVLDIRDLWPDIYLHVLPGFLRPVGRVAIRPLVARTRRMCRDATAIYGVSQSYLDWGLAYAQRERTARDLVFPLGYEPLRLAPDAQSNKLDALRRAGVDGSKVICLFAGLLERLYDVETVFKAAALLNQTDPGVYQFVVCGAGSKAVGLRRLLTETSNVVMLGWVEQETIAALMSLAAVGLASYAEGAPQSLPNKPFEYMAGGLAIATSLKGELPVLLDKYGCGLSYQAGNPRSLAAVIRQLTSNPTKLSAMQERSRRLFETQFDVRYVYPQFAKSLVELVNNLPTPQPAAA